MSSQSAKTQRILACMSCQQRKVKCDRQFPCSNCTKARLQCVPATLTQRRRRRLPERELLDRLRKYESLLRQNNIPFEPLHKTPENPGESRDPQSDDGSEGDGPGNIKSDISTRSASLAPEYSHEAKNVWQAMSQGFRDVSDGHSLEVDIREAVASKAWERQIGGDDNLLFGSHETAADLSTLHPEPVQMFRLWQIYLDNVNTLLKVTHTPSLQVRIIEAASDRKMIEPTFESLMFGIYCMAIRSLTESECQATFGTEQNVLLARYQFGCQQALLNCSFLRTKDRDCLTALFLYLLSVDPSTNPQSRASLLGIAIRIADRMGIHNEADLAKCTVFEAEMRRRLWWSLMLFDSRISELAKSRNLTLEPSWDCRIPLNVNDADLRPEMKEPPPVHNQQTEATFAVTRAEVGEFVRNSAYHLDFTKPILKTLARRRQFASEREDNDINQLEKLITDRYLTLCDQENRIHFITFWTTRVSLARSRLMGFYSKASGPSEDNTRFDGSPATSYALDILQGDTKIMTSPLTEGLRWLNRFHFPFPAYVQVIQDLRRRQQESSQTQRAWDIISDHYEAWVNPEFEDDSPIFRYLTSFILRAWEGCEASWTRTGNAVKVPTIVLTIRRILTRMARKAEKGRTGDDKTSVETSFDDLHISNLPAASGDQCLPPSSGMLGDFAMGLNLDHGWLGEYPMDIQMTPFNSTDDWGSHTWGAF